MLRHDIHRPDGSLIAKIYIIRLGPLQIHFLNHQFGSLQKFLIIFAHSTVLHLRPAETETETMNSEDTYHSVQEHYASVARQAGPDNQRSYERKVATAFGYSLEDLRSIPDNANLGVSCGNPLATANIRTVGHIHRSPLIAGTNIHI